MIAHAPSPPALRVYLLALHRLRDAASKDGLRRDRHFFQCHSNYFGRAQADVWYVRCACRRVPTRETGWGVGRVGLDGQPALSALVHLTGQVYTFCMQGEIVWLLVRASRVVLNFCRACSWVDIYLACPFLREFFIRPPADFPPLLPSP